MSRARDLADSADKDIAGTLTLDDLSVSGTVTGNVTGDLTGDVTGDVTGNLTGDVTGGLTGNVTGDVDLNAIAATISDTAVDIFVYDTRKDSDGGAWRKRTQHTSWYNETLNTATRGSRKEFPAVAVIVCRTNTLTIYDGDDPDLPMWMVFNTVGSANTSMAFLGGTTDVISSCSISNGTLVITIGNASIFNGIRIASFVSEKMNLVTSDGYRTVTGISDRNVQKNYLNLSITGNGIVNNVVNDVAMTVLPNAPIDAATGLPVPTIAVATDGGVSVIKDDGTVNSSSGYPITSVAFSADGLRLAQSVDTSTWDTIVSTNYLSSGFTGSNADGDYSQSASSWSKNLLIGNTTDNAHCLAYGDDYTLSLGFNSGNKIGLFNIAEEAGNTSNGLLNYTTSSYNTGWMNGDIKLATLSDTDATNVTGSELVTNGTFDSDVSGWSAVDGTIAYSSGQALVTRTGGSGNVAYQDITTVVGSVYVLSGTTISTGTGDKVDLRAFDGSTMLANAAGIDNQTVQSSATFTATSTTTRIWAVVDNSGTATIDNVSVRLAEEDRSVNGNGLQVFGTVTKSAVATGADLVGFGGFASNISYLQQPYNADFDIGSSGLCYQTWAYLDNINGAQQVLMEFNNPSLTDGWRMVMNSGRQVYVGVVENGTYYQTQTSTPNINVGQWTHLLVTVRNGTLSFYINGKHEESRSVPTSISAPSTNVLRIGRDVAAYAFYWNGSLALARVSKTVPSPDQIRKIYEDEKVLFQDGAQATLYGSSDAVTALAYDDSTELLHVGTSAGRSVFQGLRRVDNTTTAVGAAISASNGLVADE